MFAQLPFGGHGSPPLRDLHRRAAGADSPNPKPFCRFATFPLSGESPPPYGTVLIFGFAENFLIQHLTSNIYYLTSKKGRPFRDSLRYGFCVLLVRTTQTKAYFIASSTATAQATVAPTMGLLPMPIRPIISTCAGTEEEPANCASPCILPMESVRP